MVQFLSIQIPRWHGRSHLPGGLNAGVDAIAGANVEWSEHKDRNQWEETGELLDRLGVFFRSREAILGDHPKLKWLLGWSHYLR